MKIKNLHRWNLSPKQAIALQKKLAPKIKFTPVKKFPKLVAGLDCAFSRDGKKIIAAVVVLQLPELKVIETKYAVRKLRFPYIPGLLSFREAPACLSAVKKLKNTPDAFLIDGQGFAHPRRFGIASHLGLFLNKPTIGCAKSLLIGTFENPASQKGSFAPLKDKTETIGVVLRTATNVKPIFISVGNNCRLKDAIKIVLACTAGFRIPEPTRLADHLVSKLKLKV
jgi:deoxyribonuclease V